MNTLFFKIWFAFVAVLAVTMVGGMIFAGYLVIDAAWGTSLEDVGAAIGRFVKSYREAAAP